MVEADPVRGDGIIRRVNYGAFRKDKPITPGYSAELLSVNVDPQFYDKLDAQPFL